MKFLTRKLVTHEDLNPRGYLHGGQLLKWIDEEGGIHSALELQTGLIVSGVGISAGTTVSSLFQSGDGNTVGSITVNANQTIADNVDIRIGDIPSSVYLTYGFEVIT